MTPFEKALIDSILVSYCRSQTEDSSIPGQGGPSPKTERSNKMERKLNGIAIILIGMMLGMFSANLNGLLRSNNIPFVVIGLAVAIVGIIVVFIPKKS